MVFWINKAPPARPRFSPTWKIPPPPLNMRCSVFSNAFIDAPSFPLLAARGLIKISRNGCPESAYAQLNHSFAPIKALKGLFLACVRSLRNSCLIRC